MEEKDPNVVAAAYILCSFTEKMAAPSSPPELASLPSAGQKKKRSRDEKRSRTGWIAAAEAAKIVAEKTAEVLAANGSSSRSSPDSPLDFRRMCEQTPPAAAAAAADVTTKKARLEKAKRSRSEEKQTKLEELEELTRTKEEVSAAIQSLEGLKSLEASTSTCAPTASAVVADEEKPRLKSLEASTSTCAPTASAVVADEEKPRPQESQPRIAPPSSSSSSLRSKGDKFLFDLNLPPPDDC